MSDADLDRSIGFIQLNALPVKIAGIAERSDAAMAQKGLLARSIGQMLLSGTTVHGSEACQV